MSKQITGYLEETETKEGKTKKGRPWVAYRGKIDGQWVAFGFNRPTVNKGDYVRVTLEEKNGFEEVVSAEKLEAPAVQPPAPSTSDGHVPYVDKRQAIITYQSSRKDALALVAILEQLDAVPITAAKTAAGKAKRFDEVMALVDKLTVQYYYDVETLRNIDRIADGGVDGPLPDALPEDAQAVPTGAEEADDAPTAADVADWK